MDPERLAELKRRQAEKRRQLELEVEQRGPLGKAERRSGQLAPPEEEDKSEFEEERETLEVEPEAEDLEIAVQRPERTITDRARDAAATSRQRLDWVTAHTGPVTPADHRSFDQQIRQPEAAAARSPEQIRLARLRELIIWREILGPPLGLRDRSEDA
jgi:hypothetical protein